VTVIVSLDVRKLTKTPSLFWPRFETCPVSLPRSQQCSNSNRHVMVARPFQWIRPSNDRDDLIGLSWAVFLYVYHGPNLLTPYSPSVRFDLFFPTKHAGPARKKEQTCWSQEAAETNLVGAAQGGYSRPQRRRRWRSRGRRCGRARGRRGSARRRPGPACPSRSRRAARRRYEYDTKLLPIAQLRMADLLAVDYDQLESSGRTTPEGGCETNKASIDRKDNMLAETYTPSIGPDR
jgi:hypothetical protein